MLSDFFLKDVPVNCEFTEQRLHYPACSISRRLNLDSGIVNRMTKSYSGVNKSYERAGLYFSSLASIILFLHQVKGRAQP